MAENTSIEWATHTFNAWSGCTKVSPGCKSCYAEALSKRNPATLGVWGAGQLRKRMSESYWRQPLKWNAEAAVTGERPRVFCASLADWLDDEVPIEWLADLLDLIRRTPNLDWLLLTKRPQNWENRLYGAMGYTNDRDFFRWLNLWMDGKVPPNVWLGTTVEDQTRADERIPLLLSIPARVRFLSCEPLLGPLNNVVGDNLGPAFVGGHLSQGIDWVICGGESGPGARPMHPDWARSLRDQCQAAGVPFLFKQHGEWIARTQAIRAGTRPDMISEKAYANAKPIDGDQVYRVGKHAAGRLLDGRTWDEFPTPTAQPATL